MQSPHDYLLYVNQKAVSRITESYLLLLQQGGKAHTQTSAVITSGPRSRRWTDPYATRWEHAGRNSTHTQSKHVTVWILYSQVQAFLHKKSIVQTLLCSILMQIFLGEVKKRRKQEKGKKPQTNNTQTRKTSAPKQVYSKREIHQHIPNLSASHVITLTDTSDFGVVCV